MPKLKPNPKGKRKMHGGKFARPDIDWDLAEQYYICGEIIREQRDGTFTQKDVSMNDVSRKFKCSVSLVHYHAKRRKWTEKREDYKRYSQKVTNEAVARARAMSFVEASGILDKWLLKFQDQVDRDKVRVDALSDFNIAMRLKRFIDEQPIIDTQKTSDMSINRLQGRHKNSRSKSVDDNSSGTDDQGDPSDPMESTG